MIDFPFRLRGGEHVPRCERCALHQSLCVCGQLAVVENTCRVSLLIHIKEWAKTSNSGRLLNLSLSNSEIRIRGRKDHPMTTAGLELSDYRNVVLYPSASAKVLSKKWMSEDSRPVHLIVPDGNWRQAKSMLKREPLLKSLEHVRLPDGLPSRYRLRSHPDPERVSTFEAVARAMGVLESSKTQERLERNFDIAVERALWIRGRISAEDVTGGIPEHSK